eukprot:479623-Prorocentrum_minimum.AAC.1
MPLVFFTSSRVLRRAWRLHLTDTSPPQLLSKPSASTPYTPSTPPLHPLYTPSTPPLPLYPFCSSRVGVHSGRGGMPA